MKTLILFLVLTQLAVGAPPSLGFYHKVPVSKALTAPKNIPRLVSAPTVPSRYRPLGSTPKLLADTLTLTPSYEWTSEPWDVRYTENQSLYYDVSSATNNGGVTISMEGTLDGIHWAPSTATPTLATLTGDDARIITINSAPVMKLRIKVTETTGTVTSTFTLIGLSQ